MKRSNITIEQIADIDNLRLAYWKARKGKKEKNDQKMFAHNLDKNLLVLSYELLQERWKPSKYHTFVITDPKERLITAAPFTDRVVHHAITNLCHDNFEQFLIEHTYATRKQKGTYQALYQAAEYHKKSMWYLKLDVRHYFETIDHQVLKHMLERRFKKQKVLHLFSLLIDSYHTQEGKGIPIGSIVSQYFANHYLAHADHYIKSILGVKYYVRYMDDMVLWHQDKNKLWQIGQKVNDFFQSKLSLTLKAFTFNNTKKKMPFLGYLLDQKGVILLAQRSRKRFINKIKLYNQNLKNKLWNQQEYQQHIIPLLAFVQHANSHGFRKKILGCV